MPNSPYSKNIVNNINQLLVQAQAAYDVGDWSLLTQCLQQLILETDSNHPEVSECREHLLELALSVLEFGDFGQRWDVAKLLVRLGNIIIPPLVAILEDESADEELHWYAVRILGDLKSTEVISTLVQLLQLRDSEELRGMAAIALGELGEKAIFALSELLEHEKTRLLATQTLAYIRHKDTLKPLLTVVDDSQVAVRHLAIEALSIFHDERVSTVLLRALNDENATIRRSAVLGLGFWADLCSKLDLVARLQPLLYDPDVEVACAATISLSRMGCDGAAQHLYQVLVSPQSEVKLKIEAIRALAWVGTVSGLEYLQQSLYLIESQTLWLQVVTVLGRVQDAALTPKAADILLEMLRLEHPAINIASIKNAIASSLGQLGQVKAVETLKKMLEDKDKQVQLHAIAALKNLVS